MLRFFQRSLILSNEAFHQFNTTYCRVNILWHHDEFYLKLI